MDSQTEQDCVRDVRRVVRRMLASGMNSEDVKMWFVNNLPRTLRQAALLPRLPPRQSKRHNVHVPPGTQV